MKTLTPTEILNLLDALKTKFGSGDIPQADFLPLYYSFVNNICEVHNPLCEKKFNKDYYNRHKLFVLASYYKAYKYVFDKEPFNLAEEIYNAFEVNTVYGTNLLTSKKITDKDTVSFTFLMLPNNEVTEITEHYCINYCNSCLLSQVAHIELIFDNSQPNNDFLNGFIQIFEDDIKTKQKKLDFLKNIQKLSNTKNQQS